jgi:hypothetical protein
MRSGAGERRVLDCLQMVPFSSLSDELQRFVRYGTIESNVSHGVVLQSIHRSESIIGIKIVDKSIATLTIL